MTIASGRLLFPGVLFAAAVFGLPSVARAQNPAVPTFTLPKPPEADKPPPSDVVWKIQSKGGLLLTSGNSRSRVATLSLDSSRREGSNKLSLNGALSYGRSSGLVAADPGATGTTTEIDHGPMVTTTNNWISKARYDRFFTTNNAGYALAQLGADRIAGKRLYGGGQLGYSRQLLKNDQHTVVAELGYDFSYESYVQTPNKTLDAVAIHSARVFVGELFSLTKATGINGSVEALFNLNKEKALLASDTTGATNGVGAFKDTRIVGKVGLTTTLFSSLSFGFGFTLKYDQNPAPRPLPAGAMPYAANFQPFADKLDTQTEATLIYTFL
jgi:hypothetical protein